MSSTRCSLVHFEKLRATCCLYDLGLKNEPTCPRSMLPRNTATDSTTAPVVAPRRANTLSGEHAIASSSAAVPFATSGSQFAATPREAESARTSQFVAKVVAAIQDAYTCSADAKSQHHTVSRLHVPRHLWSTRSGETCVGVHIACASQGGHRGAQHHNVHQEARNHGNHRSQLVTAPQRIPVSCKNTSARGSQQAPNKM